LRHEGSEGEVVRPTFLLFRLLKNILTNTLLGERIPKMDLNLSAIDCGTELPRLGALLCGVEVKR
jgi:hypothetical protein